jgi:agmatine deiminase
VSAADDGFVMPPEWGPHERTLMAWPCRRELWGRRLQSAYAEYAGVANAIVAFEPVTMVCANDEDAAHARARLSAAIEIVRMPIDDSWLRDSGPIFVTAGDGRRAAVHFGFNSWGEKFVPWDQDAAVGALLAERVGDDVIDATDFVLEGGSIGVDGTGLLITTEECLLSASRNPSLDRSAIEQQLRENLGVDEVLWLGQGLVEDRDTDGHVDLIAALTGPREVLLLTCAPGDPNHERMAENRERAIAAGLTVTEFPLLARVDLGGEPITMSYMNFYVANGCVVVPTAGVQSDVEALDRIAAAFPGREVIGTPGTTMAYGGGGPHCITQQVPAAPLPS